MGPESDRHWRLLEHRATRYRAAIAPLATLSALAAPEPRPANVLALWPGQRRRTWHRMSLLVACRTALRGCGRVIDTQDARRLAGDFLAHLAGHDDVGMRGVRLVLDDLDDEDHKTWRLAVYLLARQAVLELADLHGTAPRKVIDRLTGE